MVSRKTQAEEIVFRNKGDIKDLLHHIDQEIHINSIMSLSLEDGLLKNITQAKASQLQLIKTELQIALDKYQKKIKKNLKRKKLIMEHQIFFL